MAQVRLDIHLGYPPERVWAALTDRTLLDRWFLAGGSPAAAGETFRLYPRSGSGIDGPIDVEVVEAVAPRRLVMRWTGPALDSEMTWTLLPTKHGCRLYLIQAGILGTPSAGAVRRLREAYRDLFGQRLPEALATSPDASATPPEASATSPDAFATLLEALATSPDAFATWPDASAMSPEAARAGAAAPAGAVPATAPAAGAVIRAAARLRQWSPPWEVSASVGVAAALAALAGLSLVLDSGAPARHAPPPPGAAAGPTQVEPRPTVASAGQGAGATGHGAAVAGTGTFGQGAALTGPGMVPAAQPAGMPPGAPDGGAASAPPGGTAAPTGEASGPVPTPGAASLLGEYQTVPAKGNGYYQGEISLTATGAGGVDGWTVTITVPDGASVKQVDGATSTQHGQTVRFTPDGDAQVTPDQPVTFTFRVHNPAGTDQPLTCSVDGQPCAGLGA